MYSVCYNLLLKELKQLQKDNCKRGNKEKFYFSYMEHTITFISLEHLMDMPAYANLCGIDSRAVQRRIREKQVDRKSTRLNSSHLSVSRMPSSA